MAVELENSVAMMMLSYERTLLLSANAVMTTKLTETRREGYHMFDFHLSVLSRLPAKMAGVKIVAHGPCLVQRFATFALQFVALSFIIAPSEKFFHCVPIFHGQRRVKPDAMGIR